MAMATVIAGAVMLRGGWLGDADQRAGGKDAGAEQEPLGHLRQTLTGQDGVARAGHSRRGPDAGQAREG